MGFVLSWWPHYIFYSTTKSTTMKKGIFLFLMLLLPIMASAQTAFKFGYLSFEEALKAMPDYAVVQRNMADLRNKYAAEAKRSEDDFNAKYEQFLDGQRDFAPSILQKRQAELQELMEKNIAFKKESERLLKQAEVDAVGPLKAKLNQTLKRIGAERGYAFILNTDGESVPYVDSSMGENITAVVIDALR